MGLAFPNVIYLSPILGQSPFDYWWDISGGQCEKSTTIYYCYSIGDANKSKWEKKQNFLRGPEIEGGCVQ